MTDEVRVKQVQFYVGEGAASAGRGKGGHSSFYTMYCKISSSVCIVLNEQGHGILKEGETHCVTSWQEDFGCGAHQSKLDGGSA